MYSALWNGLRALRKWSSIRFISDSISIVVQQCDIAGIYRKLGCTLIRMRNHKEICTYWILMWTSLYCLQNPEICVIILSFMYLISYFSWVSIPLIFNLRLIYLSHWKSDLNPNQTYQSHLHANSRLHR